MGCECDDYQMVDFQSGVSLVRPAKGSRMTAFIAFLMATVATVGASILIAAPVNADPTCICQLGKPCQTSDGLPCSHHRDNVPAGPGSPNDNGPVATNNNNSP